MTYSGPPYWAFIWFVIITGTITTAIHLSQPPKMPVPTTAPHCALLTNAFIVAGVVRHWNGS